MRRFLRHNRRAANGNQGTAVRSAFLPTIGSVAKAGTLGFRGAAQQAFLLRPLWREGIG
jgi:hypothetical protein